MKKLLLIGASYGLFLKAQLSEFLRSRRVVYRVLDINLSNQVVLIQIKGKNVVFKKLLPEILGEPRAINRLSSIDACRIGFYYGKLMRNSTKSEKSLKKPKHFEFFLSQKTGQYRIISENREGEITYLDKIYRKNFVELPTAIIQSRYIIGKFDPTQACYIGMRAGMMLEKTLEKDQKNTDEKIKEILSAKPILRVVK